MKTSIQFLIVSILMSSCFKNVNESSTGEAVSHEIFDTLLKRHVQGAGLVNYKGFDNEHVLLDQYLNQLQNNPPAENFTENEKLAYWINAYNAFTIELILQHKPDSSIKDIGSKIQIPFINTPWQIDFIKMKDKTINLDDIEHGIIRKQFNEPRIHFALVCASISCPNLRQEAYTAAKLDAQLNDQAKKFINDPTKNKITEHKIIISKIFDWMEVILKKKEH